MEFLHWELELDDGDQVQVNLNAQANVLMMSPADFDSYRQARSYRYFGGLAQTPSVRLTPPHPGLWHIVVDLGGYGGRVRADVRVIKAAVRA